MFKIGYLDAGEMEDVRVRVSGHGTSFSVSIRTFFSCIQQGPVQRVQQFTGRCSHILQVSRILPAMAERMRLFKSALNDSGTGESTYRSLINWAVQSMTCGRDDWTNFHRGMDRMASVKLGDSPNWMFWTRTFSSDFNNQTQSISATSYKILFFF